MKDGRAAGRVAMPKNDVRNQLLEAGVVLDLIARAEARVRRIEQLAEILLHVSRKTLKMAQPVKKLCRYDQDVFSLHGGHVNPFKEARNRQVAANITSASRLGEGRDQC